MTKTPNNNMSKKEKKIRGAILILLFIRMIYEIIYPIPADYIRESYSFWRNAFYLERYANEIAEELQSIDSHSASGTFLDEYQFFSEENGHYTLRDKGILIHFPLQDSTPDDNKHTELVFDTKIPYVGTLNWDSESYDCSVRKKPLLKSNWYIYVIEE